jgi:transcriptional regulator with XRE-family HTH domain
MADVPRGQAIKLPLLVAALIAEAIMDKDWQAVADAITGRLSELEMTQRELSGRSGVSVATIRQLSRNYAPRRRNPRTLTALSEGLRWPADYLARVLAGNIPAPGEDPPLRDELNRLRLELADLRTRLEAVEHAVVRTS